VDTVRVAARGRRRGQFTHYPRIGDDAVVNVELASFV
jgi:hypothetical protein